MYSSEQSIQVIIDENKYSRDRVMQKYVDRRDYLRVRFGVSVMDHFNYDFFFEKSLDKVFPISSVLKKFKLLIMKTYEIVFTELLEEDYEEKKKAVALICPGSEKELDVIFDIDPTQDIAAILETVDSIKDQVAKVELQDLENYGSVDPPVRHLLEARMVPYHIDHEYRDICKMVGDYNSQINKEMSEVAIIKARLVYEPVYRHISLQRAYRGNPLDFFSSRISKVLDSQRYKEDVRIIMQKVYKLNNFRRVTNFAYLYRDNDVVRSVVNAMYSYGSCLFQITPKYIISKERPISFYGQRKRVTPGDGVVREICRVVYPYLSDQDIYYFSYVCRSSYNSFVEYCEQKSWNMAYYLISFQDYRISTPLDRFENDRFELQLCNGYLSGEVRCYNHEVENCELCVDSSSSSLDFMQLYIPGFRGSPAICLFFSDVIKKIKLEKALSRKIFLIVFGMDLHYSMVARALRCLGNKKLGSRYKKVLMEMERGWLFYSLTACFYDRKDKRGGSHEVSCPYRVINAKRF